MVKSIIFRAGAMCVILIFFTIVSLRAICQEKVDYLPKVILPSPSQSMLLKFEEIPVSLYTGIPDISIPFYTIKSKGVKIPVSLSYHASGVKVSEVAPWVGQNWSLSAGGAISRLVRNAADDRSYYSNRTKILSNGYLTYGKYTRYPYADNEVMWNEANGNYDSEPDIYFFNFPNYNGKFVFRIKDDDSPEIVILTGEKLKITYENTSGQISSFTVITPDGFKFLFNDVEASSIGSRTNNSNDPVGTTDTYSNVFYNSSWLLTKVLSPNGFQVASFEYTDVYEKGADEESQTQHFKMEDYGWPCKLLYKENYVSYSHTETAFNTKKIAKISFSEGSVDFINSTTSRPDLGNTGKTLDKILIKDYSGNIKKQFRFVYGYSTNSRLYLDKILEGNNDGSRELSPYEFSYYKRDSIPYRGSYAVDYWGFYNSKSSNTGLTPPIEQFNYSGANRDADTSATFGSLIRMKYPTGGITTFKYELNDYSYIGRDTLAPVVDQKIYQSLSTSLYAIDGLSTPSFAYVGEDQFNYISYGLANSTTYPASITAGFSPVTLKPGVTTPASVDDVQDDTSRPSISVSQSQTSKFYKGWYMARISIISNFEQRNYTSVYLSSSVYNPTYKLQPYKNGGGIRIKSISYDSGVGTSGVRTIDYGYRNYSDTLKSSGSLVSGIPLFNQDLPDIFNWQDPHLWYVVGIPSQTIKPIQLVPCMMRIVSSSNLVQYELTAGGNVGYANVTVRESGNGETHSYFTSPKEYPDTLRSTFPYAPPTSYEAFRGNLVKEATLNKNKDTVKVVYNTYDFSNVQSVLVNKSSFYRYDPRNSPYRNSVLVGAQFETFSGYQSYLLGTQTGAAMNPTTPYLDSDMDSIIRVGYKHLSVFKNIKRQVVEDYSLSGKLRSVDKKFVYNTLNNQIYEERDFDSKGDSLVFRYQYPLDYNTTDSRIQALLNKNIINSPIDVKKIKNNKLLTQSQSVYNVNNLVTQVYKNETTLGAQVGTFNNTIPYTIDDKKIEIYYDNNLNIVSYKPEAGSSIAYLWGYHSSYPVAEVKGADTTEIAYANFESESKGNWIYTGNPTALGTAVTGEMVYGLSLGALSKTGLTSAKKYTLSYLTQNPSAFTVTGTVGTATKTPMSNNWNYYEHQITGVTSLQLMGDGWVDDVRLYPTDAQMTTYTYDPIAGLTSTTDAKGQITYYEYDEFLRLLALKDQNGNIIKTNKYHYKP